MTTYRLRRAKSHAIAREDWCFGNGCSWWTKDLSRRPTGFGPYCLFSSREYLTVTVIGAFADSFWLGVQEAERESSENGDDDE